MTQPFWKMHGAGNDFILFDDRAGLFPLANREWMASVAARRTGVGCEGIILLQAASDADFRMRFFNPDGRAAEMCGNGARCAARLAFELGIAPASMTIVTDAGVVHANVNGDAVELSLPDPVDIAPCYDLEVDEHPVSCGSVNTGVPHVMLEVQDLDEAPVATLGATIRHHPHFAPAGTNVNFVRCVDTSHIEIRTYERGVEAETGACGTGAAAAAIVMTLRGRTTPPVTVTTVTGDQLHIGLERQGDSVTSLTLAGPAVHVYMSSIELPA
ncbi:MAG: diaminopimelate epimerase [Kiritimatiellia bacterium]|jgi:diaminopimelate epimerase|nr:diaminopimelate epimerase [Kiritimatiellia bacterium]MDP6811127.1 diaminopimelate epimerase [Kiritimatiellia bacterium]MDP7024412.1 diaminopimelate epimerase [Kiritimatiellia bacterium]